MNDPLKRQVGGTHYMSFPIQPFEFIHENGIGFGLGEVLNAVVPTRSIETEKTWRRLCMSWS